MKWISIYDKKPLKEQIVLILLASGNPLIGKFDGIFFTYDGLLIENIAYWCALPEIKNFDKVEPYNYQDVEWVHSIK